MDFLDKLDQRKSVRHFQPNIEIKDEEIIDILNHAANAPSNNNSQPWKVIVIKNQHIKDKLKIFSYNQEHVSEASALFLILGDKQNYKIENLINASLKYHLITELQVAEKQQRIEKYFSVHPEDREEEGLRLDIGLFSMNLMHVLRAYGYDSVPMRGIEFDKVMKYLDLPNNWSPILLLPVGKAKNNGHHHSRENAETFTKIIHWL
ncbi:NADH dehydrogenase [Fructilactobacillus lindneri]|uniref:NADH dehydrogenase n=2 Tax=Fructilactobacillus lindneri TaxID=53444 RepID=A0A0R2JNE3_9LACO|nr:nitroreductase family protein [Fructilactobacillus lindneri]ANZ57855.1 NADH dehydrogenase [Fructilactobacillus lindneri]ANZ59124.1 NADH dehydrogenase [Fructilactobacillus lindneri]KRN78687.1 NADH dehydrogenase [Fructilactobacillus lindneri DSM 20690 = JCM 11027]POG98176.1 NADH dehydrogenase [Fructilactobacillus lindneri]POH01708.1 NADH dehydrogenase [Fructilactobacillus lindneri]